MNRRGLGTIYQRGSTWWIQYFWRGKKYCETSGSKVRMVALKLLRRRLGELARGQYHARDMEKTTFEDLALLIEQDYRINRKASLKRMERALKNLRAYFGISYALDITLDRLNAYVEKRQNDWVPNRPTEHIALASIKYELSILRRAFRLAQRANRAICPPFLTITVHNTRKGFFERPQFEAVRRRLSEDLQPVVTFAYLTGWRLFSEILPLQ
jgi:hypothetical protein